MKQQSISLSEENKVKLKKLSKEWGVAQGAVVNYLISQYGEQAVLNFEKLAEILQSKTILQTRKEIPNEERTRMDASRA